MSDPKFLSDDEIILSEFVDESQAALAGMDQLFVALEKAPSDSETVNAIFRPIHSLKANSAFLGLMDLKVLAHAAESVLDSIRKNEIAASSPIINLLLESVDALKAITSRIRNKQLELDPVKFKNLLERLAAAKSGQQPPPPVPVVETKVATPSHPESTAPGTRTMRVSLESLEALAQVTDDLARVQSELSALVQESTSEPTPNQIRAVNQQFDAAATRLRQGLAAIRKVPLQELFQKIPRMVRDTAASCNKQVTVRLAGEQILVSRELVQLMDSPMVHIIRNSVDHGAELPEDRVQAGKPAECTIAIQAYELPGELILKISDDGRGLDLKALLLKALKTGAVKTGQKLTQEEMTNLIFLPGLSTAKQVTDVSGRGIGMDVVRDSIQKLGGKIEVSFKPGQGTDFMLYLPNP